jgi:hypothetical protein
MASIAVGLLFLWPLLRTQATGTLLVAASHSIPWAQDCYYFFLIVSAATVIAVLFYEKQSPPITRLRQQRIIPTISVLSALGNLFVAISIQTETLHPIILILSTLVFSVCIPLLFIAWANKLVVALGLDFRHTGICIALTFTGSFFITFLQYIPSPASFLIPIVCPLFAGLCWSFIKFPEKKNESVPPSVGFKKLPGASLSLLIVTLLVSCIFLGIVREGSIAVIDTALFIAKDITTIVVNAILAIVLYIFLVGLKEISTSSLGAYHYGPLCGAINGISIQ